MILRALDKEKLNNTFFLGPRKIGKTTYLKENFPDSLYIDFLDNDIYFEFQKNPGSIYENILYEVDQSSNYKTNPIILDEVQRVPIVLNEVHRLIENHDLNFILCGSSARKLVRGGANMLGGRASRIVFSGLTINELNNIDLLKFINQGGIPSHYLSDEDDYQIQIKSYIQNYINEEVKGEALVRNLRSFTRFLDLLGFVDGEEVNYTNIARDVGVDSKTVKEYFQILIDTLLGNYIYPYFDRHKRTNISKAPKFYLFDTGVTNYLKGISLKKEEGIEFGKSFEQIIFNEILAYKNYNLLNFDLSFWRTYEQDEVDFILGDAEIAIEVKGTKNVTSSKLKSIKKFRKIYNPKRSIVVSNTDIPRKTEECIEIIPYLEFVKQLWDGEIIDY